MLLVSMIAFLVARIILLLISFSLVIQGGPLPFGALHARVLHYGVATRILPAILF
jgi:hypothetical protein